jgi:hypothetical protein
MGMAIAELLFRKADAGEYNMEGVPIRVSLNTHLIIRGST